MLSRSSFLRESSSACGARGGCARYNGAAAAAPSTPARWRSHFRWPRARTTGGAASAAAGTSSAAAAGRVGARLCASFGACARNQKCASQGSAGALAMAALGRLGGGGSSSRPIPGTGSTIASGLRAGRARRVGSPTTTRQMTKTYQYDNGEVSVGVFSYGGG